MKYVDISLTAVLLAGAVFFGLPHQARPSKAITACEWRVPPTLVDFEPVAPAIDPTVPLGEGCTCGCVEGGVCTCASCLNPAHQQAGGWLTDYATGRERAVRLKLPMLVQVSMTPCVPCRALEKTLAKMQPELAGFVCVRVDREKDSAVVQALGVATFPAIVVSGPGPELRWLSTTFGNMPPERVRQLLKGERGTFIVDLWPQSGGSTLCPIAPYCNDPEWYVTPAISPVSAPAATPNFVGSTVPAGRGFSFTPIRRSGC